MRLAGIEPGKYLIALVAPRAGRLGTRAHFSCRSSIHDFFVHSSKRRSLSEEKSSASNSFLSHPEVIGSSPIGGKYFYTRRRASLAQSAVRRSHNKYTTALNASSEQLATKPGESTEQTFCTTGARRTIASLQPKHAVYSMLAKTLTLDASSIQLGETQMHFYTSAAARHAFGTQPHPPPLLLSDQGRGELRHLSFSHI